MNPIATIEKILKIESHPNADRLRIATVLGWKTIIGLDDYNEGDMVIYIRPDSIIPGDLIAKFKLEFLKKDGRLKTIRLRGAISQGLGLPINIIDSKIIEGREVSEELRVTKWEPPAPKYQQGNGNKNRPIRFNHPDFHKYTKIQNIKNYNSVFQPDDIVIATEKIHGTNTRYGLLPITKRKGFLNFFKYHFFKITGKKHEFVYGSHNVQLDNRLKKGCYYSENVYQKMINAYKLDKLIPEGYTLYGEIYGDGIQKGYNYGLTNEVKIVFFDMKKGNDYLNSEKFLDWMELLNLPVVPILYKGKFKNLDVETLKKGKSILYPEQEVREGIVITSVNEDNDILVGRKILKCISEDYLLLKNNSEFH